MTETLEEMTRRVGVFQRTSVPVGTPLILAPGLRDKVAAGTGELLPYYGSTVLHRLDDGTRSLLDEVAEELHEVCGSGLADRLPTDSLHVTLHDLRSAPRLEDVAAAVFFDDPRTAELLGEAAELGPVEMRLTTVFSLVSTSVVVGLLPATEDDCVRLLAARARFDEIVPPSGPFTPHITLAYYRPDAPEPIDPARLARTLDRLTERIAGGPVTLTPERLRSTHFSTMARYWDVGPA